MWASRARRIGPVKVVLHRVRGAVASLDGEIVASIGGGLALFVGFERGDTRSDVDRLADRVAGLRVFEHGQSKFGESILEAGGAVLTVAQFTLAADLSRGRKPNFSRAAPVPESRELYARVGDALSEKGVREVVQAPFGTRLEVDVKHWGPFTVTLTAP